MVFENLTEENRKSLEQHLFVILFVVLGLPLGFASILSCMYNIEVMIMMWAIDCIVFMPLIYLVMKRGTFSRSNK